MFFFFFFDFPLQSSLDQNSNHIINHRLRNEKEPYLADFPSPLPLFNLSLFKNGAQGSNILFIYKLDLQLFLLLGLSTGYVEKNKRLDIWGLEIGGEPFVLFGRNTR